MDIKEDEISGTEIFGTDTYVLNQLPGEHCFYCGIHSVETIAKCEECGRWFCNDSEGNGSHIALHIQYTGHLSWTAHELNRRCGQLMCQKCNKRDITMLTVIDKREFLCRKCAVLARSLRGNIEIQELVSNGKLNQLMFNTANEEEKKKRKKISKKDVRQIEVNVKSGKDPFDGLDDLAERSPLLPKIKKIYGDAEEYSSIYYKMLNQDMLYNKNSIKEVNFRDLVVNFDNNSGTFEYDSLNTNMRLRIGMVIELHARLSPSSKKQFDAIVSQLDTRKNRVTIKPLNRSLDRQIINKENIICEIHIKYIPVPYERMVEGLNRFRDVSFDISIKNLILGIQTEPYIYDDPSHIIYDENNRPNNLPPFNESQKEAIQFALSNNLSIIKGPPGTGKTHTCASIIWYINKFFPFNRPELNKILVTSSSNAAVDNLVERLHRTGLKVVKVAAKLREKLRSSSDIVENNSLHVLLKAEIERNHKNIVDLFSAKYEYDEQLEIEKYKQLMDTVKPLIKKILEEKDIICCTNITSADERLDDFQFPYVIIDEANQSSEPESLLPLLRGCRYLVLVGDDMQLGPITKCSATASAGLTRSLMTRLIHVGHVPKVLTQQYRMHPSISEFPKSFFYDHLEDGITAEDRGVVPNLWPNNVPNIFIHSEFNAEASAGGGTSVSNINEAFSIYEIIKRFTDRGILDTSIVVLTPYEAQKRLIIQIFDSYNIASPVFNIDEFQGNEADYVIFSTVRSNLDSAIGFLSDFRRLNVAITRAKFGMVILGNFKVLEKSSLWAHLVKHYSEKHYIYEGMFGGLRYVRCTLGELPAYNFLSNFPYSS